MSHSLVSAADGCLQYYTGVAGRVESFNYNMAAGLQLSDTDYSVCVRMERNFCGSICVFLVLTRRTRPGVDKVEPKVWFKYSLKID